MNKRMRELLAKFDEKIELAKSYMEGENKDLEKASKLMDEAEEIKKEFELEKRIFEQIKEANTPDKEEIEKQQQQNEEKDAVKQFAEAARNGFRVKDMSEGSNADGGYTVPEDIQTKINTYRESKASLLELVTVEPVSTNKGSRTFKSRAQQTGFKKVGEHSKIGKKATPQFTRLDYEIEKFAGYFPVTNELLEDSDQNITDVIVTWIGDESRVTANQLILAVIAAKEEVKLEGLDDIKKAFNVTLGQAFKPTSTLVTNDDGLQYLDTLKDADGKYLLQPDPANPMQAKLCAGTNIIPVKVYPNEDMQSKVNYEKTSDTLVTSKKTYYTKESDGTYKEVSSASTDNISNYYEAKGLKVPFICGDLKEGIIYFDRKKMNIKVSDVAQIGDLNAYEEDLTIFRAIEREDVKVKDEKAFVNGYILIND